MYQFSEFFFILWGAGVCGQKTLRCFLVIGGGGGGGGGGGKGALDFGDGHWGVMSFLMSHRPKCYHRYFIRNFTEIPSKSLFISSRMSLQTLPCPVLFLVPDIEEEWGHCY